MRHDLSTYLLGDALPSLLDGRGVTDEGGGHLESLGRDVANGRLHVVGDPFDEVGRVLVHDVQHLLVDFLRGHTSTEEDGARQVTSVARIGGAHHVLGIKHLLGELGHREGSVLLASTARQGSVSDHEEVKTREWNHVHCKLSKVTVELTRESKTARRPANCRGDEVVQIAIRGRGELEGSEANVVQRLVVKGKALVGILDELVHGKRSIVRLDDRIRNLGRWNDRVGRHDAVGVLLSDLGDEESSHTGTGPSSHRMGELETLHAIATFCLLPHDVEH